MELIFTLLFKAQVNEIQILEAVKVSVMFSQKIHEADVDRQRSCDILEQNKHLHVSK